MDPAEFDLYRAGRRTGEWFYQKIEGEILDMGHTPGWIPVGQTSHERVLSLSDVPCEIAIMYQWETAPEHQIWFHV